MRTVLTVIIDIEAGNRAIKTNKMGDILGNLSARIKPESSYFWTHNGERRGQFVFDLHDPSDIPSIAEPLFMELNARVEFAPVMNLEDLQKGLARTAQG